MADQFISVPTLVKGMFRMVGDDALPRYCGTVRGQGSAVLHDAVALARQDTVMQFLLEMDRKLDAVLNLLQRESLEEGFPLRGYVIELSGSGLALESKVPLSTGDHMELLLLLEEYPQRIISVMGTVLGHRDDAPRVESGARVYSVRYECLYEEDRELIIQFVFREERKRIRQRKGDV